MPNGHSAERAYSRNGFPRYYDLFIGPALQGGRELSIEALQIMPRENILELGTGTALTARYYPSYCRVMGVDLSDSMLRKGRQRIQRLGIRNVELLQMDATRLAFADGQFDKVLAAHFINVVRDPLAAIAEMKRVCRKGGYIIFINHFLSSNRFMAGIDKVVSPLSRWIGFYTDVSYERLIRDSGLVLDQVVPVQPAGLWKVVRCLNP